MAGNGKDISELADAAFKAAGLEAIETCIRTKTPLLTEVDGEPREIPHNQIEQYIDVEALRNQVEQQRPTMPQS